MAKGLSIHVGLNRVDPRRYHGWEGRLVACEADARDMSRIAAAEGFAPTVLLTEAATADAVIGAIAGAAEQLGPDDILFLTYSGHGGQVPDGDEDEEDAQDETWLLYDRQLLDDELHALWSRFAPGTRILVLSDSCHSGTVARGLDDEAEIQRLIEWDQRADREARTKAIPPVLSRAVFEDHRELYTQIKATHRGEPAAQCILMSGCQDDQESLDGQRNGLFTGRLLEVWAEGAFAGGHRDLHEQILSRMPPTQTPNYLTVGSVSPEFEAERPLTIGSRAGDDVGRHVIVTEADGVLRTSTAEIDRMVDAIVERGRGVIHFHGGLVEEQQGMGIARSLLPVYTEAGAYPVFFVWRSGVREIVTGNVLREIGDEPIFKELVKLVLRFAVGKVREELGVKSAGGAMPTQTEVERELREPAGPEPFADVEPSGTVRDVTHDDEIQLELDVMQDMRLQGAVQAAIAAQRGDAPDVQARTAGVMPSPAAAVPSRVDPEALAELSSGGEGARGLLSTAALARKALKILTRVISRFRNGRAHGVYLTVVEEVLREFYFAAAGGMVWQMMKRETADTFAPGRGDRGGAYVLERLGAAMAAGPRPEITLVGHSTGAVFINNLLAAIEERRKDQQNPFPADFTFRHVVFLAPACTFTDFEKLVARWEHLWRDFRMFTMNDEAERRDQLVKLVYPRSLLYFVSGLLERDADGNSEGGKPLVGLARYFDADADSVPEEVQRVRTYIEEKRDERVVWSPVRGAPGFSSGATSHGGFDDDEEVRSSLKVLIGEGSR